MADPTRIFFAKPADAKGNASINVVTPTTLFAVLVMTGQCAGNPNWIVAAGSQVLAFGNGSQVNLGPILTNPGEQLTISVSGAQPNAQITGLFAGNQFYSADEAASNYSPVPNLLSINAVPSVMPMLVNPSDSGIYSVQPNKTITNQVFPIPPGTQSVLFQINEVTPSNPAAWSGQSLIGNNSTYSYFVSNNPENNGALVTTFQVLPQDTQLLFSITTTGSPNAIQYLLVAYSGFGFVESRLSTGPPSDNSAVPISGAVTVTGNTRNQTFDWQAANQFNNTTASLTGPTPPAGKTAVLAAYSCHVGTNAASTLLAQVSVKDGTGALIWADIVSIVNTAFADSVAQMSGLAVPASTTASPLTISIGVIGAAHFADLSIGGYFV